MRYGLIGEHLSHSFSKEIHETLADYTYDLIELASEELAAFFTAKEFSAVNVTIPYKQAVIPLLDELSESAAAIGAVNTVVNRGGRLYGYNTDYDGLIALLQREGISLRDKKVLILGSGGTSRTAEAAAKALGARETYRVSRTGRDGCITYGCAYADHSDAEVILNTTPVGMYPNLEGTAIDLARFPDLGGVCDVVYNPICTQLVLQAKARGIAACGGLYMLVGQAVSAIGHFTGTRPDPAAAEAVYRDLLQKRQNIVLIGMPGCGKSTVGALLAEALGRPLYEMDDIIVQREGCPITDLFAKRGEAAFRGIETALARELAAETGAVISTGGGIILREENLFALRQNGRLVFLDRPLADLLPTADRPLSSDQKALQQRFDERYDRYRAAADVILPVTGTPQQVAQSVLEALAL